MEAVFVSLVILVIVVAFLWFVSTKLPSPFQLILQVITGAGVVLWFLSHVGTLIHAITSCCR